MERVKSPALSLTYLGTYFEPIPTAQPSTNTQQSRYQNKCENDLYLILQQKALMSPAPSFISHCQRELHSVPPAVYRPEPSSLPHQLL